MSKEKIDTNNKFILPANGDVGSEEARRQLIADLQKITPEQVRAVGSELEEKMKIQPLLDFRKAWREKIKNIDETAKSRIEEATKNIPVKIEVDDDGSRLIEFKLGGKKWKILDPKLKTHSDDEYFYGHKMAIFITKRDGRVKLSGMMGDNIDNWKNKPLADYVKQKQEEGLHIAKIEEIREILSELGKQANLSYIEDREIAMLMYLTGIERLFWLSMGDDKISDSQRNSRSMLCCFDTSRHFDCRKYGHNYANLCMIACE